MATQAIAAETMRLSFAPSVDEIRGRNLALLAAQQRRRRGPAPEAFFNKHLDNTRLVKADDPVRAREMRLFAAAMTVLFLLLMTYGWQHFSAIEYGYRVATAKQHVRHLEEQNRHLRLSEAQLCDPGRIDRLAHKLGLAAPAPGQIVHAPGTFRQGAPVYAEATPPIPGLQ